MCVASQQNRTHKEINTQVNSVCLNVHSIQDFKQAYCTLLRDSLYRPTLVRCISLAVWELHNRTKHRSMILLLVISVRVYRDVCTVTEKILLKVDVT